MTRTLTEAQYRAVAAEQNALTAMATCQSIIEVARTSGSYADYEAALTVARRLRELANTAGYLLVKYDVPRPKPHKIGHDLADDVIAECNRGMFPQTGGAA